MIIYYIALQLEPDKVSTEYDISINAGTLNQIFIVFLHYKFSVADLENFSFDVKGISFHDFSFLIAINSCGMFCVLLLVLQRNPISDSLFKI
jgi:hypothetical protein